MSLPSGVGEFEGSAGRVLQRSETTSAQRDILKALAIEEPRDAPAAIPGGKRPYVRRLAYDLPNSG